MEERDQPNTRRRRPFSWPFSCPLSVAFTLVVWAMAGSLFSGSLFSQEWTRFRGPNGSGVSDATTVPVDWAEVEFNWTTPLAGIGCSSPVVWGDRLFVTSADGEKEARYLFCIGTGDGSILWRTNFGLKKYKKHKNNSFASNTPAVDGDHVYLLWQSQSESPLVAYSHSGEEVWKIDLGPYLHGQGGAVSPIVFENSVIVCNDHKGGSYLLSVDRQTGEQNWKIEREGKRACYSTPCVFHPPGRSPEIIFTHSYEGVVGVDAATGKQNWHIDVFGTFSQRAIGSPIISGDLVIGSSGFVSAEKNLVALRTGMSGGEVTVEEVYRVSRIAPHVPTPLVYRDLMFLWGDNGIVSCVRVKTGELVWKERAGGTFFGSPVCVNGRLYCVDRDGNVVVIDAAEKFQLLARNSLGNPSKATPAVSGGTMFLRSDSHVYSIGGRKEKQGNVRPPVIAPREVSFQTKDGARIYGHLYGEGDHAVVLAHGAIFNKESWDPLARELAGRGLRVLAIDFRGYGKSKGGSQGGALFQDVLGAVAYLHEAGAHRVSVIGGSMGGGAAAQAAIESGPGEIDRLILLAAVPTGKPNRMKGKILFIVSEGDGLRRSVEEQFKETPDPKKLVILEGSAHAQHIFKTEQSGELTRQIVDWLGVRSHQ